MSHNSSIPLPPLSHRTQPASQGAMRNPLRLAMTGNQMNPNRLEPLAGRSIQSLLSHHDDEGAPPRLSGRANLLAHESNIPNMTQTHNGTINFDTEMAAPNMQGTSDPLPPVSTIATIDGLPRACRDLLSRFPFEDSDLAVINQLLTVRPEEQWTISLILIVASLKGLTIGGDPLPREPLPRVVPQVATTSTHHFGATVRSFLRRQIREILTTGNVEAYSRTHTTAGLPIARTCLALLTNCLEQQPLAFRTDYLPEGWPRNHHANQSVMALMRCLLKHERGSLRNLLLTNVKEFNRRPIDGPVPKLADLILIIDRAMGNKDALRPIDTILTSYTATMKIRMAYIRLEVIHYYLNPDPSNPLTQWDLIDRRLEILRRQSDHFKDAFARLIVRTDHELFGETDIQDLPIGAIVLPTDEEVEAEIRAGASAAVQNVHTAVTEIDAAGSFN